jgi:hypothetical protein
LVPLQRTDVRPDTASEEIGVAVLAYIIVNPGQVTMSYDE